MTVAASRPGHAPLGFTFTETMAGFIGEGAGDYQQGAALGRSLSERLRFVVTVTIPDLDAFVKDPDHAALLTGTVRGSLPGGRAPIEQGAFNLFSKDERGRRQMRYRFAFQSKTGVRYRLEGYKDVYNDHVIDVWRDTTTLFTTLRREDQPGEPVVARGVLHIKPLDLIPQVWSMRGVNARGPLQHGRALARFGLFFGGQILDEYALSLRHRRRRAVHTGN